ncbi:MAG: hypothetical protein KC729_09215 [Candidatus Eisenbacteria bacterium]|uniref:PEP-CTERM sorting domain-containing protein n=1 Tax=Eiseniibacteriota bacterium TaxID=2212470 RepID=A0A956LZ32_UNCEI|nr:hypothetical protein [Candidatus Eisenbacteria bacterium]
MYKSAMIACVIGLGVSVAAMANDEVLVGHAGNSQNNPPSDRYEVLFWGDLTPELGLGCSNASGTSGGPNDVAVGVTANQIPPIRVSAFYYNIFTQVSPNISQLDFVVWEGGPVPGAEIFRQSIAGNWAPGDHTVTIRGCCLDSPEFYFGQAQSQADVGMRWGVDTSSGSWGTSYIRAPVCGAASFTLLDNLGFPGNWVMAVTAEGGCTTPVELASWGSVKSRFR